MGNKSRNVTNLRIQESLTKHEDNSYSTRTFKKKKAASETSQFASLQSAPLQTEDGHVRVLAIHIYIYIYIVCVCVWFSNVPCSRCVSPALGLEF